MELWSDISRSGSENCQKLKLHDGICGAALDGKPDVSGPEARGEETERRRFASVALLSTNAETFVSAQRYYASRLFQEQG